MYSVLLVDDEKIIREGIYELLSMEDLDLDLTMAASAVEAISVLDERKIDIVLTDIRMPQMSGLELYDVIREKWSHCKIIFLTGHLEFDYVYKVHKHARYVLKAEEDEKIVEAVKESIEEIENDLLLERAVEDRFRHQQRNKYYERTLLLKELVDSSASSLPISQDILAQMDLDIHIDLGREVYGVLIRCAGMSDLVYQQRLTAEERVEILIEKFYMEQFDGTFFGYNRNLTYLLLQPRKPLLRPEKTLEGLSETFQKAVSKNLSLDVSIFINRTPSTFQQAIIDFPVIRDKMLGIAGDEISIGDLQQAEVTDRATLPEPIKRELSRKGQLLEQQFDSLDRVEVLTLIQDLQREVQPVKSMNDLFVLELYFSISTRVLSYARKVGLREDTAYHIGITRLYNISRYRSWADAFRNLHRVAEQAFQQVDDSIENKNENVVNRVKTYIVENLDGNTSLYALSSHVHLCPEHLLRVFKKQEGVTILQYINDLKLVKAKQMLAESDMQVKDIAEKLGFTSAGYFGRFFKSKLGVTPNYYREQRVKPN